MKKLLIASVLVLSVSSAFAGEKLTCLGAKDEGYGLQPKMVVTENADGTASVEAYEIVDGTPNLVCGPNTLKMVTVDNTVTFSGAMNCSGSSAPQDVVIKYDSSTHVLDSGQIYQCESSH
jgi:hypothetical protein